MGQDTRPSQNATFQVIVEDPASLILGNQVTRDSIVHLFVHDIADTFPQTKAPFLAQRIVHANKDGDPATRLVESVKLPTIRAGISLAEADSCVRQRRVDPQFGSRAFRPVVNHHMFHPRPFRFGKAAGDEHQSTARNAATLPQALPLHQQERVR